MHSKSSARASLDSLLVERKTLMPTKITFAGKNSYKFYLRGCCKAYITSSIDTYQTDAPGDNDRKREEDVHGGANHFVNF